MKEVGLVVGEPCTWVQIPRYTAWPLWVTGAYSKCNCNIHSWIAFTDEEWDMTDEEFAEILKKKLDVLHMTICEGRKDHAARHLSPDQPNPDYHPEREEA